MKRPKKTARLLAVAFFAAVFLGKAEGAFANGNASADVRLGESAVPSGPGVKKSVRRAPIRRPAKKAKKPSAARPVAKKPASREEPRPTSLDRGVALLREERYNQARPWLQKAVQEERGNPYAWYWYGLCHEMTGQLQQAQFFYAKALERDPAFPPLSRVVTYPDDGNRKALWDPVRPARVFPVESKGKFPGTEPGIVVVPPGSPEAARLPARPPLDPERPKVPVYVPPDPSDPLPPDVTQPPVYVPPGPPEAERSVQSGGFGSSKVPVYVPPAPAEAPE